MSKAKIHFKNEPFTARVAGNGNDMMKCTPVVYDEASTCGVGVLFENGHGQVWGLTSPRNLITAWRATEVLCLLASVESGTLCAAYFAGQREPHESDVKSHVDPIIAKIGRQAYNEIMARRVPEEIVRAILDNQKGSDHPAPDLWPITDEVRAGTIQWRQEFTDAGIVHPDVVDAKKRAQEQVIARFEQLLSFYARSRDLPRQCLGMGQVEAALLTLDSKGATQKLSDRVLVALSGVVGELASFEFMMGIMPFGGASSPEDDERQLNSAKRRALGHSATWLASNWKRPRFAFWRRPKESFTQKGALELLSRLLEEYFPQESEVATPA